MGQKNNKIQFDQYKDEVYDRVKDTELLSIMSTKNWQLSKSFKTKLMANIENINVNLSFSISKKSVMFKDSILVTL